MEPPLHMSYICYRLLKSPCCYLSRWCEGVSRFRVCESEWMPLNAEYAIDGVNEEEAICGGLITKVSAKKVGVSALPLRRSRSNSVIHTRRSRGLFSFREV